MSNDSIAGHCADCSFYRFYLLNYGRIIGIPFAAAAAGFVTFVKSNAKALLTLRIKSALRSPRGNGECGFSGSLRRGLQVVPTLQNPRRDRQSFSNRICCNAAAHRQRRFGKSSLPSISNSADFSMGTVVRYQSATLCRKCNKCRKLRFHAAGFTMIFTSDGLPTDCRSGSSNRMYPCPSNSSSVGKISSVFLKNFPRHI